LLPEALGVFVALLGFDPLPAIPEISFLIRCRAV
jgi:hypothetical protein